MQIVFSQSGSLVLPLISKVKTSNLFHLGLGEEIAQAFHLLAQILN